MDFGAAGRHLHDIFYNGFGTKVIVSDPYASDSVKSIYPNVKFVSFEILLERSDIIFIHVPLSPETNHLFNKEAFRKMKNTAMVINTACIPIINQKDLVWALQEGEILYAGLDTVEKNLLLRTIRCLRWIMSSSVLISDFMESVAKKLKSAWSVI